MSDLKSNPNLIRLTTTTELPPDNEAIGSTVTSQLPEKYKKVLPDAETLKKIME